MVRWWRATSSSVHTFCRFSLALCAKLLHTVCRIELAFLIHANFLRFIHALVLIHNLWYLIILCEKRKKYLFIFVVVVKINISATSIGVARKEERKRTYEFSTIRWRSDWYFRRTNWKSQHTSSTTATMTMTQWTERGEMRRMSFQRDRVVSFLINLARNSALPFYDYVWMSVEQSGLRYCILIRINNWWLRALRIYCGEKQTAAMNRFEIHFRRNHFHLRWRSMNTNRLQNDGIEVVSKWCACSFIRSFVSSSGERAALYWWVFF